MSERLHKILARHGLGSRREIERWIAEGRVTVNRKPAQIGDVFQPGDRVAIDGKEVTARLNIEVAVQALMYHKPQGQPLTHAPTSAAIDDVRESDAEAEAALDRLPSIRGSRWIPINPMHAGDSGLLLVTNDGNLSYALTRRKRFIPTTFMVRVLAPRAELPPEIPLSVSYDTGQGVEEIAFTEVEPQGGEGSNLWYRVVMPRADHRAAVRALFESRELKVSRMTQVGFGDIELPRDLPRGRHRALIEEQISQLYALAQIPRPKLPEPPQRSSRAAPDRRAKPKTRAHRDDSRSGNRDESRAAHRSGRHPANRDKPRRQGRSDTRGRTPRGR